VNFFYARTEDDAYLMLADCVDHAGEAKDEDEEGGDSSNDKPKPKTAKSLLKGMITHGRWMIRLAFHADQVLTTQTRATDSLQYVHIVECVDNISVNNVT
jgi:hypothetical protein